MLRRNGRVGTEPQRDEAASRSRPGIERADADCGKPAGLSASFARTVGQRMCIVTTEFQGLHNHQVKRGQTILRLDISHNCRRQDELKRNLNVLDFPTVVMIEIIAGPSPRADRA